MHVKKSPEKKEKLLVYQTNISIMNHLDGSLSVLVSVVHIYIILYFNSGSLNK